MKTVRGILVVNLMIQTILGGIMVFIPSIMSRLIYVAQPNIFVQAIGSVALSIGLLIWLCLQKTRNKSNVDLIYTTLVVLTVFNLGLSIFLGLGAYYNLISWLGVIIHLPLMLLCLCALLVISNINTDNKTKITKV